MISPEKFLEEASETVTKPFKSVSIKPTNTFYIFVIFLLQITNLNDNMKHEFHLARLEYELEQRKKLSELCNTFEDEKKQLATGIFCKTM